MTESGSRRVVVAPGARGGGDAVYALGIIGALVYFLQQADGFWEYVLAVLKGLVWPAILVYQAFGAPD